jgi:hypothetical protein
MFEGAQKVMSMLRKAKGFAVAIEYIVILDKYSSPVSILGEIKRTFDVGQYLPHDTR